jgi:prefoldin subunit 5
MQSRDVVKLCDNHSQRYEAEVRALRDEVDVLQSQAATVRKLEDTVKRYKESLEGLEALKTRNKVEHCPPVAVSWPV